VRKLPILAGFALAASLAQAADPLVYVGTYTRNGSRGIYAFRFSPSGKLEPLGLAAETPSPSFLAEHPNHKFLYAVNEAGRTGSVSSFAIDAKTGKLTPLNTVPSGGNSPCHLAVDKSGKWLFVANYGDGVLSEFAIQADGKIGDAVPVEKHTGSSSNKQRQAGPHAHEVVFSPDGKYLLLADLGLDKIFVYKFDPATGKLTPNDPPAGEVEPGSGVRHFAFHPDGRTLYAINEISRTVTAFHWDPATGKLTRFQTVPTEPESFKGTNTSTAEIAVNKAGTRVYGSNRGHDSIVIFAVDKDKKTLTPMEHTPTLGKTPRHFTLDPTGKFLLAANQDSSDITIFSVHPNTGQLTPVGKPVKDAPLPVCILFSGAR
jgi:6-phosphogluconolactonase